MATDPLGSRTGELGVVSGTALDVVCARRLMSDDPGGHMRQALDVVCARRLMSDDPGGHMRHALAAFPIPAMARRVMKRYYIHGGRAADEAFRAVRRLAVTPPVALQELTVVGAFCEVRLAKQHSGPVGIDLLRRSRSLCRSAYSAQCGPGSTTS